MKNLLWLITLTNNCKYLGHSLRNLLCPILSRFSTRSWNTHAYNIIDMFKAWRNYWYQHEWQSSCPHLCHWFISRTKSYYSHPLQMSNESLKCILQQISTFLGFTTYLRIRSKIERPLINKQQNVPRLQPSRLEQKLTSYHRLWFCFKRVINKTSDVVKP